MGLVEIRIIALFAIHYTMGKVVFDRLPFTMDIAIMATAYMLIGYTSEAFLKKIKELNKFEAIVLEVFTLGILIISVNCSEIGLLQNRNGEHRIYDGRCHCIA